MAKILIVEDDVGLARMVSDWLKFEHHMVEMANNGRDGLDKLKSFEYDLVVLDVDLPELSGIEVCKEFRSTGGTTPVLLLTGKNTLTDKETGFGAGADDYLTKPFHMKELSMRLRALLRRAEGSFAVGDQLKYRDIELDVKTHRVTRSGKELQLLPKEFALLEFLMRHQGQVFNGEALLSRVWASESETSIDAVSTCIKRLRKKIDLEGENSLIRTVHGVGYKLDPD
ncbi:MAG TPA: response regulator transcription factor [Candidatus Obscuribacterales bacterium]